MRQNNLRTYKEIIHNVLKNKCKVCKTKDKLHIHHKDGNHKNNKLSNIELLCNKHHFEVHKKEKWKVAKNIEVIKNNKGLYEKECPFCLTWIYSLNENQMKMNFAQHIISHGKNALEEFERKNNMELHLNKHKKKEND